MQIFPIAATVHENDGRFMIPHDRGHFGVKAKSADVVHDLRPGIERSTRNL
jgi:hypothetical protein